MKHLKIYFLFGVLFLATSYSAFGIRINKTIYLNAGLIICPDSLQIPAYSLSEADKFTQKQETIRIEPGDTLLVLLVNHDSLTHIFSWQFQSGNGDSIGPGNSKEIRFVSSVEGFDHLTEVSDDARRYMGITLPVMVLRKNKLAFLWNISEKSPVFSQTLIEGKAVDFSDYDPEYFFINGLANPETLSDTLAHVEANIGDSIELFIFNSGMSVHSLHFHGYHLSIIESSAYPNHTGRSKDTFPLLKGEFLRLLLVPDKKGEYPVHDHNLVAVSGGGIYPNGMFTTLLIH